MTSTYEKPITNNNNTNEADDSLSVYNEKELEYLDKYLPLVKNAFDEDELYEIILDCNYNDEKIKRMIGERTKYLKAKGTQYGWNVVDSNRRLKPVEQVKPVEEVKKESKKSNKRKGKKGRKQGQDFNYEESNNNNQGYYGNDYYNGKDYYYSQDYNNDYTYSNKKNNKNKDYYTDYDYNTYYTYNTTQYDQNDAYGNSNNTYADNYYAGGKSKSKYNYNYESNTNSNNYTNYDNSYGYGYNNNYQDYYNYDDQGYTYTNKYKKKRRPKSYYTQHNHYYQNNYYGLLKDYEPEIKKPVVESIESSTNNVEEERRENEEAVDENNNKVNQGDKSNVSEPVNITSTPSASAFVSTSTYVHPTTNNNNENTDNTEEINVNKTDIENLRSYFDKLKKFTIFDETSGNTSNTLPSNITMSMNMNTNNNRISGGIYEKFSNFTGNQGAQHNNVYTGHGYGATNLPGFNPEVIEQNLSNSNKSNHPNQSSNKSKLLNNLSINNSHALEITTSGSKMEADVDGRKIVNFSFAIQGTGKKLELNQGKNIVMSSTNNTPQPIYNFNQTPYMYPMPNITNTPNTVTPNTTNPTFDNQVRYNPYLSQPETYSPEMYTQQPMYDYQQYSYYQMPYRVSPMQFPGYQGYQGYPGYYQERGGYQYPQEMYNPNANQGMYMNPYTYQYGSSGLGNTKK